MKRGASAGPSGGPGPGGARRTPRGPGGGSRCPTRHSAPPLAPPPPASLMGDEPRDSRPFGRDVTVQNARRAPGSKPSCFVSEVVAAARGRSPRQTYCQAVLVAVQVMGGSLRFADEESGPETLENFPRPSRQSVAGLGLGLRASGGHAPALGPSAFRGAGTPEGSRPVDRLLAFRTRRGRPEPADRGGSGPRESSSLRAVRTPCPAQCPGPWTLGDLSRDCSHSTRALQCSGTFVSRPASARRLSPQRLSLPLRLALPSHVVDDP